MDGVGGDGEGARAEEEVGVGCCSIGHFLAWDGEGWTGERGGDGKG